MLETIDETSNTVKYGEDLIDNACENYKYAYNSRKDKFSKLDEWLGKESTIFKEEALDYKMHFLKYKRGQIIKVDFGVNVGTELSHLHFALVLNDDDSTFNDNITVLPLTSKSGYKRIDLGHIVMENVKSKRYNKNTYGMITQIKTISKKRILLNSNKIICSNDLMKIVDEKIIKYLTKNYI